VHITLALHSALHAFAGVRVKNLNFWIIFFLSWE
jgi:hypothetical protein